MAYAAPFAAPYVALDPPRWYTTKGTGLLTRTGFGKQVSDVTLEGASFHGSFLMHESTRETPKKMKQRMAAKKDSLPGDGIEIASPQKDFDEWSFSSSSASTTASPVSPRHAGKKDRRRHKLAPLLDERPSSSAGMRQHNRRDNKSNVLEAALSPLRRSSSAPGALVPKQSKRTAFNAWQPPGDDFKPSGFGA